MMLVLHAGPRGAHVGSEVMDSTNMRRVQILHPLSMICHYFAAVIGPLGELIRSATTPSSTRTTGEAPQVACVWDFSLLSSFSIFLALPAFVFCPSIGCFSAANCLELKMMGLLGSVKHCQSTCLRIVNCVSAGLFIFVPVGMPLSCIPA